MEEDPVEEPPMEEDPVEVPLDAEKEAALQDAWGNLKTAIRSRLRI